MRYDGGAVAPYNRQARTLPPPAAATVAPITRKRPSAQAAPDGRLLRVVPRTAGTANGMHPRGLSRLLQAFMWPAIPGAKRRPSEVLPGGERGGEKRTRPSPSPPAAAPLQPSAPRLPSIQITYAQPQDYLADRLQRMLQQALAQGLGPLLPRRPAVVAQAVAAHTPTALTLRAAPTMVLVPGSQCRSQRRSY